MLKLYIMKLGGSVCTDKTGNRFHVNEKIIRQAAREIKQAQHRKHFRLIVVNGAGPFGHTNVHQYRINNGVRTRKDFEGASKTTIDCLELNWVVSKLFWKEGLLAYPLPASSNSIQKNKKIIHQDIKVIQELFRRNKEWIPVLNGTFTVDTALGGSVISGDASIANLSQKLKADKIFFGTDVNGVYTQDPKKNPTARQIPSITGKNWRTALQSAGEASTIDVSQGMKGKLLRLAEKARGTPICIFDAQKKGNVQAALLGKKIGTKIKL